MTSPTHHICIQRPARGLGGGGAEGFARDSWQESSGERKGRGAWGRKQSGRKCPQGTEHAAGGGGVRGGPAVLRPIASQDTRRGTAFKFLNREKGANATWMEEAVKTSEQI